jgi:hypothetical protein
MVYFYSTTLVYYYTPDTVVMCDPAHTLKLLVFLPGTPPAYTLGMTTLIPLSSITLCAWILYALLSVVV